MTNDFSLVSQHRFRVVRGATSIATLATVLALCLMSGPSAKAEIRTATVQDPQDAPLTVSGVPTQPDIKQVHVRYDTAGSLSLTIDYFNAPGALDTSSKYAFWGYFSVGTFKDGFASIGCDFSSTGMVIGGQHHIYAATWTRFYDQSEIAGYEGKLEYSRITSQDGKQVTISAASPVLANRDFRCFQYEAKSRYRSSASNIYSDWDESCGCWAGNSIDDVLGIRSTDYWEARNFFDGYAPVPPSPSKPRARLWLSTVPSKCRAVDLSYWTLSPDRVDGVQRGWPGKLRFELRANGTTLIKRSKPRNTILWKGLRPGRYLLVAWYPGDKWRSASKKVRKFVRVYRC